MQRDNQIFRAVYFAEIESLKTLVKTVDDFNISIAFPKDTHQEYKIYWETECIRINILHLLNWMNYTFYEYFDSEETSYQLFYHEKLKYTVSFNPALHYKNTIACLEWICNTFGINNYYIKDYSRYRLLRSFVFEEDYWLSDDDMKDALDKGFQQLDLDLINQAEIGNGIKVYDLIKKGANPAINPIDLEEVGSIYSIIESDFLFHKLETKKYLGEKDIFKDENSYYMLESLYKAGVSNYILDIIYYNKQP